MLFRSPTSCALPSRLLPSPSLTPSQPLTNGAQVKTGSCNNVPIGVIAAQSVMPSSKFQNPKNLDTIAADTTFTIEMKINNVRSLRCRARSLVLKSNSVASS